MNVVDRTGIKRDEMADMRFWDVFTPVDMPKVGFPDKVDNSLEVGTA